MATAFYGSAQRAATRRFRDRTETRVVMRTVAATEIGSNKTGSAGAKRSTEFVAGFLSREDQATLRHPSWESLIARIAS